MVDKTDIYIYAHWAGMEEPREIGILTATQAKGKKTFSFEYHPKWIKSSEFFLLDPDLGQFSGPQYPSGKENFGVFMDSMPDTWGRTLMKRRSAELARTEKKTAPTLYEIDYLLGVNDESRMGALRFKLDRNGPFLDDNHNKPTPPWPHLRELQDSADRFEKGQHDEGIKEWLEMLIAPGSSLGGARPKANIIDDKVQLWIAKFPSKNDTVDKAAWEFLAYELAINAGIEMSESKLEYIAGEYGTFSTKRFDRDEKQRKHFSSAMTMTGNSEDAIPEEVGYLDIAEFIQSNGADIENDLHQLWRRIVFNIAISNTDDHLRNHGFLLTAKGWKLSPAFDINPSVDKKGLAITIDSNSNALDFDLAFEVGEYFRLNKEQMDTIFAEVKGSVETWKNIAAKLKIPRGQQEIMAAAFKFG